MPVMAYADATPREPMKRTTAMDTTRWHGRKPLQKSGAASGRRSVTNEELRHRIIAAAGAQYLNLMMMAGERGIDLITPSQTLEIVARAFMTMKEAMEDQGDE